MAETLTKQVGEVRIYNMDFTNILGLDEQIASVASTGYTVYFNPTGTDADNLVVDNAIFSEKHVQVRIAGGVRDCIYKITIRVQTNKHSQIAEGDGLLQVKD